MGNKWKWLGMVGKGMKWLEYVIMVRNGGEWWRMIGNGWKWLGIMKKG